MLPNPDRYYRLTPLFLVCGVLLLFGLPWLLLHRAQNRELSLTVSTGQPGGVYNPLAEAIGEVVSDDHPRIGFEFEPGEGSVMSMRRLEQGECDLALLQNGTPGGEDVRIIAPLYEEVLHILVPVDSEASTLRGLRGRRLAVGPVESGTQQVVKRLFDHYSFDDDDFKPVYTDMKNACEMLLGGKVEAVFVVAGIHAEAIRRTMATGKVRLMGIGRANEVGNAVDGLQLHFPEITPYIIPTHTYPSDDDLVPGLPHQPVQTLAVPSLLVCRKDLPDRVVNQITRSIFENRARLASRHPVAGKIRRPAQDASFAYPFHPGADAYYHRHEPNFLVQYADVIALILSIAITVWGMLVAARKWMTHKKKDRIDEYYVRIDEILTQLHETDTHELETLREMEGDLASLRHRAVQQLVAEKLQANESFRIFQTLLASSQAAVRRRIDRHE